MTEALYIGLISGTSRDGLDAALVDLAGPQPALIDAFCTAYPDELRTGLDRLIRLGRRPAPAECASLDLALGQFFARVTQELLRRSKRRGSEVRAIGSHGQTVWHEPDGASPISLQLGNAAVLAHDTGLPVVSDFRRADIDAGGQGAPLAPLLHRRLFAAHVPCAVLNLGGIANLTVLGADEQVSGFDTGPANCLMDAWCQRHRGAPYDRNGAWAASGAVLNGHLERWLDDAFFKQSPPKSTGLEHFNLSWLEQRLDGDERPEDVQRTLLELTVESVARDLEQHAAGSGKGALLLCGGGVHNPVLVDALQRRLPDWAPESTAIHGADPDWVEAILFAWLAQQRLDERPLWTGPITGARQPVLLGRLSTPTELGATA